MQELLATGTIRCMRRSLSDEIAQGGMANADVRGDTAEARFRDCGARDFANGIKERVVTRQWESGTGAPRAGG
jgi:hypothetical protein